MLRADHSLVVGFKGLFSNYYVALCALFAIIGGLLFGYEYALKSKLIISSTNLEPAKV